MDSMLHNQMLAEDLQIIGVGFVIALIGTFALYILASVGTMKIAKRCGVPCYGLAWIPIGSNYVLGAIADYYSLHYKQKKTKQKVTLPILAVIVFASSLVLSKQSLVVDEADLAIFNVMGSALLTMALTLLLSIFNYIALFRIFKLCDSDHAAIYLVLGILMSFLQPIFLFVCRNKSFAEPFMKVENVTGEPVEVLENKWSE